MTRPVEPNVALATEVMNCIFSNTFLDWTKIRLGLLLDSSEFIGPNDSPVKLRDRLTAISNSLNTSRIREVTYLQEIETKHSVRFTLCSLNTSTVVIEVNLDPIDDSQNLWIWEKWKLDTKNTVRCLSHKNNPEFDDCILIGTEAPA
jgi:hypothetical protein